MNDCVQSYTFQLQSAPIPGLVIGSVQASDVNTPPYLPLIYNLSGNGSSLFAIDNTVSIYHKSRLMDILRLS